MRFTVGLLMLSGIMTVTFGGFAHAAELTTVQATVSAPTAQARCDGRNGYATQVGGARNLLWRPEWLAVQKAEIARNAKRSGELKKAADAAMRRGPYSVRDNAGMAPSGDPADYVSIGPYWWPDPEAPDGLPYVRRDGQINPERDGERFDSKRLDAMADDVVLLTLAGHYLNDRRYVEHATTLVRTWFIDQNTRMNPNLVYAQAVPGRSTGRSFGVIDAVRLIEVAESIARLEAAGALNASDAAVIRRWFADLAKWMAESKNGQAAAATTNNHGLYFDLMLAHFSLFSGTESTASQLAGTFAERRLLQQIDTSGRLPHELARTRGWMYSVFTLKAALQMAMLGECVGIDLWRWRAPDGRSLRLAVDYLLSYRGNQEGWQKPDLDLDDPARRTEALKGADQLFRLAAWGWRDSKIGPGETSDYLLPDYRR